MEKLKFEIYNKAIGLEQKLYSQLDNYDSSIVGVVNENLAALKTEYEELKVIIYIFFYYLFYKINILLY